MTTEMLAPTAFAGPLSGVQAELVRSDGGVAPLDVRRWRAPASGEDSWLIGRCRGATIDLGCGPGRLLAALVVRGVPALGVDVAPEAIAQCSRRGVRAVHADVFAPLPGEGSWEHALLADGNLGIGGDVGVPFPWAAAGPAALPRIAGRAGLRTRVIYRGRRSFAELVI